MSDRTIRVQGRGKATAPPDVVTLRFDVSGWDKSYGGAIDVLNQRVDHLREALQEHEIERDQAKTASFRVNPTYEKVSRLGVEQQRISGYSAAHTLRVELPVDRSRLNAVLGAIAEGVSEPSISIAFEVVDEAALRQRALESGVDEATRNARTLAEAAGVKLLRIRTIEYGWAEMRVGFSRYTMAAPAADPVATPDIEPEEVHATESVTVVWEIE